MQRILAIVVLACALVAVHGRELQQAKYKTVGDALMAKENSELSTLLAAVKVSMNAFRLSYLACCCCQRLRSTENLPVQIQIMWL